MVFHRQTKVGDDFFMQRSVGDQKESSFWSVGNVKIVNGAQTTSSIAKAYSKDALAVRKGYVQIKIISLDKAPIDISGRITTATNTQNRVEPKDFLALDPIQDGLAETLKNIGVQYCYRRGEKVADMAKGTDIQELAMALAVGSANIADVVIAKRNAGSLTDPSGHYRKLFDQPIVADVAWNMVKRWRNATDAVSKFSSTQVDRDSQLAIHGNRFMEHVLLASKINKFNPETVKKIHQNLKSVVDDLYPDSYLAVLFKNAKKCEILRTELKLRSL